MPLSIDQVLQTKTVSLLGTGTWSNFAGNKASLSLIPIDIAYCYQLRLLLSCTYYILALTSQHVQEN
jgi:hypothetical protein